MSQAEVLNYLKKHDKGTAEEIAKGTGLRIEIAAKSARRLSIWGDVGFQIANNKGKYVYHITEQGRRRK